MLERESIFLCYEGRKDNLPYCFY